jgi:endonuclease G
MKAIAFLIPNKKTSKPFYDFVVSIDEIESRTGIDFFENILEEKEKILERTIDVNAWKKRN